MRRRTSVLIVTVVLGAGCGGGSEDAADPSTSDEPAAAADEAFETADPTTTTAAPTTTQTIPPEATELPDLQIVFVQFGEAGYVDLGTVIAGATIPAGGSVQVGAEVIGGLQIEGGEAALYTSPEFTDPEAIFAFVQWGTGGARADVAAQAGIWPAGASVEPSVEFNSIELGGDPADPASWS